MIYLIRHGSHQNVGEGEVGDEQVCRVPHGLVGQDDLDDENVAERSDEEDGDVQNRTNHLKRHVFNLDVNVIELFTAVICQLGCPLWPVSLD
jgi:hypothetical protein